MTSNLRHPTHFRHPVIKNLAAFVPEKLRFLWNPPIPLLHPKREQGGTRCEREREREKERESCRRFWTAETSGNKDQVFRRCSYVQKRLIYVQKRPTFVKKEVPVGDFERLRRRAIEKWFSGVVRARRIIAYPIDWYVWMIVNPIDWYVWMSSPYNRIPNCLPIAYQLPNCHYTPYNGIPNWLVCHYTPLYAV